MSSKNQDSQCCEKFKSKIGGQALVEGIMMLGPNTGAMACRLPDGTIDLETWEENNGKNAPWYKKTPLVRGCTNFVTSLAKGYKYMMKSADKQLAYEEKWRRKKRRRKRLSRKVLPLRRLLSRPGTEKIRKRKAPDTMFSCI